MLRKFIVLVALLGSHVGVAQSQFTVDPAHSSLIFKVQHRGVSFVYGRFNDISGTYLLADDGALSRIDVTAQASSVDTGVIRRDTDVRGPSFLDAQQFRTIRFQSTEVVAIDDSSWDLTGNLTLHGVTRSIRTTLRRVGQENTPTGRRIGGVATFTIERSQFGMLSGLANVLNDIEITIATEAAEVL